MTAFEFTRQKNPCKAGWMAESIVCPVYIDWAYDFFFYRDSTALRKYRYVVHNSPCWGTNSAVWSSLTSM